MGVVLKKKKVKTLSAKQRQQIIDKTNDEFMWVEAALMEERQKASDTVMDLYYALKSIKSEPSLHDLLRLAKRIKGIYE